MKTLTFECPKCGHGARAELDGDYRFLIYKCPNCDSNVVYYNNHLDVISDKMIEELKKKKRLRYCNNVFSKPPSKNKVSDLDKSSEAITEDWITDLKILLETETDFNRLMSKL
jgi:predicted RNA-binding Zn-ribbon protein involved in translation (DUF1610 family)